MPRLSAKEITAIICRDEDRVIPKENRVESKSLTAAFNELSALGFEESLISEFRDTLNFLARPDTLSLYTDALEEGTVNSEEEGVNIPQNLKLSDTFFLGAQHDNKNIDADSQVGTLIRTAFQTTLLEEEEERYKAAYSNCKNRHARNKNILSYGDECHEHAEKRRHMGPDIPAEKLLLRR
ncbi:MAG: hypothetical protein H6853_00775 [Rhodospirillales bacterium]|nr:hypothetical protein [Alphaproteobacteria bacterium]USO03850.1 MAG: hypothetical protein H6853_00775 [Rhodospirillales bacterium]